MRSPEPSSRRTPLFMIGRDSAGRWVVRDDRHLCGGLFVDRVQALKFALFENGHHPQAVIMVPGVLELDFSPRRNAAAPSLPRAA